MYYKVKSMDNVLRFRECLKGERIEISKNPLRQSDMSQSWLKSSLLWETVRRIQNEKFGEYSVVIQEERYEIYGTIEYHALYDEKQQ